MNLKSQVFWAKIEAYQLQIHCCVYLSLCLFRTLYLKPRRVRYAVEFGLGSISRSRIRRSFFRILSSSRVQEFIISKMNRSIGNCPARVPINPIKARPRNCIQSVKDLTVSYLGRKVSSKADCCFLIAFHNARPRWCYSWFHDAMTQKERFRCRCRCRCRCHVRLRGRQILQTTFEGGQMRQRKRAVGGINENDSWIFIGQLEGAPRWRYERRCDTRTSHSQVVLTVSDFASLMGVTRSLQREVEDVTGASSLSDIFKPAMKWEPDQQGALILSGNSPRRLGPFEKFVSEYSPRKYDVIDSIIWILCSN